MITIKESTYDDIKNIQSLWVDPHPSNDSALKLYRRLGFVQKEMPEYVIALGEDPAVYAYLELRKE